MISRCGFKSAARWLCAALALATGAAQAATHVWERQGGLQLPPFPAGGEEAETDWAGKLVRLP